MTLKKWILVALIAAVVVGFIASGGSELLTLENLKQNQQSLGNWIDHNLLVAVLGFVVVYVVVTALSLPGATIMTLAGGAFFGNLYGLAAVSVASTIGASLAFLVARFLMRDTLRKRYGETVAKMDRGIEKDGAFYLATLRLVPVFPFFLINLAMGLTAMKLRTYALVSWIAMLPGTFVYVNAGTQLGQIQSTGDIVSADLLLSFALLPPPRSRGQPPRVPLIASPRGESAGGVLALDELILACELRRDTRQLLRCAPIAPFVHLGAVDQRELRRAPAGDQRELRRAPASRRWRRCRGWRRCRWGARRSRRRVREVRRSPRVRRSRWCRGGSAAAGSCGRGKRGSRPGPGKGCRSSRRRSTRGRGQAKPARYAATRRRRRLGSRGSRHGTGPRGPCAQLVRSYMHGAHASLEHRSLISIFSSKIANFFAIELMNIH